MNKTPDQLGLLNSLRNILVERFNVEELQTLCFEIGIDYENLGGQGKAGKARELVSYVDRHGLITELINAGERLRPDINWAELPVFPDKVASLPTSTSPGGRQADRPVKILFLAANPIDTSPLRLGEEIREIDHALRLAKFRDWFEIEQQWAVRVSDLQDHLLRYQPDIVHFSGHGSEASEIILEDQSGSSQTVSPRALRELFRTLGEDIKCVVLNACFSEAQAQAIAGDIACVVGMNKEIGDQAAISFASAFYRGLGYGRDVGTAFELGVGQIDLEGLEEQDTPQLLTLRGRPQEIVFV
jgi:hypothetical protein